MLRSVFPWLIDAIPRIRSTGDRQTSLDWNRLISSVISTQAALGANPSGSYATADAAMDRLFLWETGTITDKTPTQFATGVTLTFANAYPSRPVVLVTLQNAGTMFASEYYSGLGTGGATAGVDTAQDLTDKIIAGFYTGDHTTSGGDYVSCSVYGFRNYRLGALAGSSHLAVSAGSGSTSAQYARAGYLVLGLY